MQSSAFSECTERAKPSILVYWVFRPKRAGFHIKAGVLNLDRPYFAAKINANFPENPKRLSAPHDSGSDCALRCGERLSVGRNGFN